MVTLKHAPSQKSRKLVVVGDEMSGKRRLLFAFKGDEFNADHVPTVVEIWVAEIEVDGKSMDLAIWNTAGEEDFDRLRPLSYPDTHVIIICFSVDNPVSAQSAIKKWTPEVRHFCKKCPVILVACKIDLRTDQDVLAKLKEQDEEPVSMEVGRQLAAQIEADAYMECSAKTREGIQELLVHAARLALTKRAEINFKCVLI